jgi:SagB-type dehydrogenase family enzyme
MTDDLQRVLAYHQRTKHRPGRYAASLGYLDWDTQPNPFRIYKGAALVPLARPAGDVLADSPPYAALFRPGAVPPAPPDPATVGSLLYHALALSAWKQHGGARWSLRVNPSSGNLHPTEAYLLAGPAFGLSEAPGLYHYSPLLHALERRATIPAGDWRALVGDLPDPPLLLGLSSIAWREAWKYGERAFRYCHHDVGHAIAAIAFAAALHGWRAHLVDDLPERALTALLGLGGLGAGVEAEHPDCLLALVPGDNPTQRRLRVDDDLLARLEALPLDGEPNPLSEAHHEWPVIAEVAAATARHDRAAPVPETIPAGPARTGDLTAPAPHDRAAPVLEAIPAGPARACDLMTPASAVIRRRRSAVAMDGRTGLRAPALFDMLLRTLPGGLPADVLAWPPAVDLAVFVHRVADLDPGLYLLLRDPAREVRWRAAGDPTLLWQRPPGCPEGLPLFLLRPGDVRRAAAHISCAQDIAADGVAAFAMLADFRAPLAERGPAFYRRLFWETGAIGQLLYLEAEALGIAATGIGCFFDDLMHELLGLRDDTFQSLYHFTIGGRVDDPRLRTLDPYFHLEARHA